jgi:hypothetical protein
MLSYMYDLLTQTPPKEAVRYIMGLPRYTPEQLISIARRTASQYVEKLETHTLDSQTVYRLKTALRQPVTNQEEATSLGNEIAVIFTEFLMNSKLENPNPVYDARYFLALMDEESYDTTLAALNNIYKRLDSTRAVWFQAQINAVQSDMKEELEAEAEFQKLTETAQIYTQETGEA